MEVQPRVRAQCCLIPSTSSRARLLVHRLSHVLGRRKGIPLYVWVTLFTALGGFLWGYDTGSIGPIIVTPQFEQQFGHLSPIVQGLLVSSILIAASIMSIASGPLSDRISRTYTIALGGLVFAVGAALECSAMTLAQFFVGRCVMGIGEGFFISSITVYVTEISPASSRGRLATTVQLFNTVGTMSGYFTCYGSVKSPSSFSWRFPIAVQASVAVAMAILTPFLPHSPRWLMSVGRTDAAERSRIKLGVQAVEAKRGSPAPANVAAEVETVAQVSQAAPSVEGAPAPANAKISRPNFWKQAKALWAKDVRWRTVFCIFIMGIQQCSGIDAVLYYAPILFSQAGLSSAEASFLASGVSGIVMVVLTFGSQFFQDKWSRRTQMIGGGASVAATMLLIGTLYASHANNAVAGRYTIIVLLYLFVAAFVSTWAIVCRIVCSEVQPHHTRAAAMSLGQCANWFVNCIIALSTPSFLARSTSAPYFFFGACSLSSVLVCLLFQPETKGLDLETIDNGVPDTPMQSSLRRRFGRRSSVDQPVESREAIALQRL